jgi:hypothetical protein
LLSENLIEKFNITRLSEDGDVRMLACIRCDRIRSRH